MALTSGSRLGPYEILSLVGSGGMGEVYRARDPRLGRDVAIKVLPSGFSVDHDRLRRFELEARSAAALNHPNILAVYDVGSNDGVPYVVSELLKGETLRVVLADGPLPVRKAIDLGAQICQGLAAAHDQRIVHRDVKPENVFVTRDGRAKLLDFGLAKLSEEAALAAVTATMSATRTADTAAGTVLGTVGYMSPEQVRAGAVDHRSDIFSFGAVLYEMLSGRRAFHGSSAADTMSAILKEDPADLTATNRAVAPALDRIVRHCLEKSPEERFQSARDIAFDLVAVSDGAGASGVQISAPRDPRRAPRALATAGLLAGFAAVFWAGWSLKPQAAPTFKQLTFRRGTVTAARFTPDGQTVVYSAAWQGSPHPSLYSARTDGVLSRPLDVDDADVLAISPQSDMALLQRWRRSIGWEREGMLARLALSGGASKEILDGVSSADWSSDGVSLAAIRVGSHYQLEFPIGHVLLRPASGWLSDVHIAPDQQHVAFIEHPQLGDDRGGVAVVDLKGEKRSLSSGWSSLAGLAWSASGTEIWFTASDTGLNRGLYAVTLSGRLRTVLRVPGSLVLFDISRDGRALIGEGAVRLEVMGLTPGSSRERDLTWLDWSESRALTADGRWLLLDEQGVGGGRDYSIYVRKTDGSPAARLGDGDAFSISSDGKWILAVAAGGSDSVQLLPTGAG